LLLIATLKDSDVTQGSVATHLKCGENSVISNCLLILTVTILKIG